MAHNINRAVYPDKVEIGKETAVKSNVVQGGDSNSGKKPPAGAGSLQNLDVPSVHLRIVFPVT